MTIAEGIVWTKDSQGVWAKVIDNWPKNRHGARIVADDGDPFGSYGKDEAIGIVEGWIARPTLPDRYYQFAVVPGKEMAPEDKKKLQEYNAKKKAERGEGPEPEPVESYISTEE